ncbi:hypothetical protein ACMFMF_007060 [Clarireedia jacksonii]
MTKVIGSATGKRFSEQDMEVFKKLEDSQAQFKDFVSNSKTYTKIEKEAIDIDSKERFEAFWKCVNDEKRKFDKNHQKGCGLFSKRYQKTGVAVEGFIQDFSPILDIVKNFASPYGSLAFGTISVLFAVAKSKHDLEEQLGMTISAIKDRLPGLKVYQHIYNDKNELDDALQNQIAIAYDSFLEFFRWLTTLGPSNTFRDKKNAVEQSITEVRQSCEELLQNRVFEIKIINESIQKENKELQKIKQDNRVRRVQEFLQLDSFSAESQKAEFNDYCYALRTDPQLNARYFQQMNSGGLRYFRASPIYSKWSSSEEPSLLAIWGYNNIGIWNASHCWLSPVATSFIEQLRPDDLHAYIIVKQDEYAHDILAKIVLQLLRCKPEALTDEKRYSELSPDMVAYQRIYNGNQSSMRTDDRTKIDIIERIATRVISFFEPSDTVYIIIDRVDRCSIKTSGTNHRKALLNALEAMVKIATCKLKVLAIINGYDWGRDNYQDDGEIKEGGRITLHSLEQALC